MVPASPGTACGARLRGRSLPEPRGCGAESRAGLGSHLSKTIPIDEPVRPSVLSRFRCVSDQSAALGVDAPRSCGLNRARITRITGSAARGIHGIPSKAPSVNGRRSSGQAASGGRAKGSTWNRVDDSNPERPPIDVQLKASGYVSQGTSEQDPPGVPRGTRRAYVGAAT